MPHLSTSQHRTAIVKALLSWYRKHARQLPWRETRNPYRILVSEIMLQQTQVSRVLLKYPEFLKLYPNFTSLAEARTGNVIRAWSGMGYNNRAIRLKQIAQRVVNEYGGKLPRDSETLRTFPGIGRYTANAIACFSFEQDVAVVDTNVRRILARLFPHQARKMDEWDLAGWILPEKNVYNWNQALMELGALRCTVNNPLCGNCPLNRLCKSAYSVQPVHRNISGKKKPVIPDRIYRGRIVAELRKIDHRHRLDANRLRVLVHLAGTNQKRKLFTNLTEGLQRDGLIQIHHRKKKLYLSLPA
jgi:A/G-specific adenine glycosylase